MRDEGIPRPGVGHGLWTLIKIAVAVVGHGYFLLPLLRHYCGTGGTGWWR
jgi:hypothetical protein